MPVPKADASKSAKKRKNSVQKSNSTTKSALSTEFVHDSDDSDERTQPKASAKTPLRVNETRSKGSTHTARIPSHSDKHESVSHSRSDEAGLEASPSSDDAPVPERPVASVFKQRNTVNDKSAAQEVKIPRKTTNHTGSLEASSSEQESEDEDSESGKQTNDSDAEDESSSTSVPKSPERHHARKDISIPAEIELPRPVYEPPAGFSSSTVSYPSSSDLSKLLDPSNLHGKQLWHVTMPANVPVDCLHTISTDSLNDGSVIFSLNGSDFTLVGENGEKGSSDGVLVPSESQNEYQLHQTPISHHVHVRRRLVLPTHFTQHEAPTHSPQGDDTSAHTSRIPQPQNLRMRYQAFGASSESDSESESKIPPETHQFRRPGPPQLSVSPRKRKYDESVVDVPSTDPNPIKPKRRREIKSQSSNTVVPSQAETDEVPATPATSKTSKKRKHMESADRTPTDSTPTRQHSSPEERAQRKAEKRRRKESNFAPSLTPTIPTNLSTARKKERAHDSSSDALITPSGNNILLSASKSKSQSLKPAISLAEYSAIRTAQEEKEDHEKRVSAKSTSKTETKANAESTGASSKPARRSHGQATRVSKDTPESKSERRRRKEEKQKRKAELEAN